MKVQNKKIIIGIITSLLLVSSIVALVPIISHYTDSYNKNSIIVSTINNYSRTKLLNNSCQYPISTGILINNLTYINKYINSTLIVKEKLLKLSILGGRYDKSVKYKNDKKKKRSELAQFSHDIKHVHRYGDQVGTTIDNSTTSLTKESGVISQIIPLIQDHPYTYNSYLNKMNISIPNISFFINKDSSTSSNNLNSKTDDISNSSYGVNTNNTNLNSIAFSSEEDGTGAKTMYKSGSSIYAAVLTKISFQARIITFDKTTNSFKYETPTSKVAKTTKTSQSTKLDSDNSEFLNGNFPKINNSSYFDSSRIALSTINSSNNDFAQDLPVPVVPNYLPGYFNNQLSNAAEAKINYNGIRSFRSNYSLYIPAIVLGQIWVFVTAAIIGVAIAHIPIGIETKKFQHLLSDDFNTKLDEVNRYIIDNQIQRLNEGSNEFADNINVRFTALKKDVKMNQLKKSDKVRILARIDDAEQIYKSNTFLERGALNFVHLQDHTPTLPPLSPTSSLSSYASSTSIDHKNNDNLVQLQNTNKTIIENIISQYATDKDGILDEIDKSATLEELTENVDMNIMYARIQLLKLNLTNYVSTHDKKTLEAQLRAIINEVTTRSETRRDVLNQEEKATDQIQELKKTNSEDSQIADGIGQGQINGLESQEVKTEKILNTMLKEFKIE